MAASLVVVHAVTPMNVPPQWRSYVETVDEDLGASARARLDAFVAPLNHERTACESVVAVGAPAEVIASLAEERHAGLIVMGLSGEGGALAPRPGSIAYRVLSRSHVPVLVVPA
jgi:nucleotide-binding universal stress UspA family protein